MATAEAELLPTSVLTDPLKFAALMWPDVRFYDKQVKIIYSVRDDDVTVVPAGNMLGKDFVAGFIAVWFFLSRSPCRIVTTSAKDDHLRVLWGEIRNFVQTARFPLTADQGGPLQVNHHDIRRVLADGRQCPKSYLKGMVASQDSIAAMQGHHVADIGDGVPRTLFIADEASSVRNEYWTMASTWARRALIIGNTWPCTNFFYKAVKGDPATQDPGGDQYSKEDPDRCYRRVIHIRAEDSPNVRLALQEKVRRRKPSGRMIIPGVKSYTEYAKNRETWDPIQQTVSLDAEFYEGAEVRLYPSDWLDRAAEVANRTSANARKGERRYLGVDVAEGGDSTVWTVIDRLGIIYQESRKTPDTAVIPDKTIALIKQYDLRPYDVLFDRGGGGYEHVNWLRRMGYKVRSVGFGDAASDPFIKRRVKTVGERTETKELQYVYKNRRAEMYGILRVLLDPVMNPTGFGIAGEYYELRRQLQPLPLQFDGEGRMWLPPKDKRNKDDKTVTIKDMLGCSPDEADSLVLACFGLERVRGALTLQVVK